jgi:hypothetical protein
MLAVAPFASALAPVPSLARVSNNAGKNMTPGTDNQAIVLTNRAAPVDSVVQKPDDVQLVVVCKVSLGPVGNILVDRDVGIVLAHYSYVVNTDTGSVPGNLSGNPLVTPTIVGEPHLIQRFTMNPFGTESTLYVISGTNAPSVKVTNVVIDNVTTRDGRTINFAADFSGVDQSCTTLNPTQKSAVFFRLLPTDTGTGSPDGKVGGDTSIKVHAGNPGETVIGNLTINDPAGGGFVTSYACADGRPNTSSINYSTAQTVANGVIVKADGNGDICFYVSKSTGATHVLWDQVGTTTLLQTHNPDRLLDTRISPGAAVGAGACPSGWIESTTPSGVACIRPKRAN